MIEKPKFSMIPTAGELQALDRKFAFQPSLSDEPRALSRAQIEEYNRDGCVPRVRIFDADEAANIRNYFNELLARELAAGGTSYSISTAHLQYGPVYDLLAHPRIVACVRDLLGGDVIGWGSHFICKMPHDGKSVAWHQDASYWPMSRSNTVTVWLAIDPSTRANGCMKVIPRTHTGGFSEYEDVDHATHVFGARIKPHQVDEAKAEAKKEEKAAAKTEKKVAKADKKAAKADAKAEVKAEKKEEAKK